MTNVERLHDLLADRATRGLEREDASELQRLLAEHPEVDPAGWDRAAAAVELATWDRPLEPLPDTLRERLVDQGRQLVRERTQDAYGLPAAPAAGPSATPPGPRPAPPTTAWTGWVAAALAAAALVLVLLRPGTSPDPGAPLEELARLRSEAPDLVEVPWQPTGDPLGAGVRGSVVWSQALQRGFLRFENLAANDPAAHQYQLWIFDAERPAETPVDGGVFDANAAGEVVVPIDPKLGVDRATLFAVTLERPGGVVVSERERLLLTAAVE